MSLTPEPPHTVARDVLADLHRVINDHADELRQAPYSDITIKVQDGRPVSLEVTKKHKL